MLFNNMTIRLLGSDDFPSEAKERPPQTSPPPPAMARCRSLSATRFRSNT